MSLSTRHTLKLLLSVALTMMVIGLGQSQPAQAEPGDLERAYKKEFIYLEAQKRALEQRVEEVKREEAKRLRAAEDEVNRLQGRLLSMGVEADRVEAELLDAERAVATVTDREDTLATTIEQARATLKNHHIELPAVEDQDKDPGLMAKQQTAAIQAALTQSLSLLGQWQRLRSEPGEMFLADGAKVKATIIRIGNIAAYGVSARGAGALAPAGGGALKLWTKDDASASAKAAASGELGQTVGVFLFESLEKNIEEKQERTILETIQVGGVVAWVIVVLGALGVLLVLMRGLIFATAGLGGKRLTEELAALIAQGQLQAAHALAAQRKGASARVLAATTRAMSLSREEAEDVIAEAILHETPRYERFGTAIMVFAAVAPLLGLLGTVTGMISTFDIITEFGTGDPKMLSGGISEALITTELGLVVAIPMLLLGNMTNGVAEGMISTLERRALKLINTQALLAAPTPGEAKADVASADYLGAGADAVGVI